MKYVLLEGTHSTQDRKIITKGGVFEGPDGLDERMPLRFVKESEYKPAPKPRSKMKRKPIVRKTKKVAVRSEHVDDPDTAE